VPSMSSEKKERQDVEQNGGGPQEYRKTGKKSPSCTQKGHRKGVGKGVVEEVRDSNGRGETDDRDPENKKEE